MKRTRCSVAKHLAWLGPPILALGACALVSFAVKASGSSPYLAVVGPAPLRFQSPPNPARRLTLPPLMPPELPEARSMGSLTNLPPRLSSTIAATNAVSASSPTLVTVPDPEPPFGDPARLWPEPALDGGTPALDPQSILGYLAPLSNSVPKTRFAAPSFVPPVPAAAAPSSHATYESR